MTIGTTLDADSGRYVLTVSGSGLAWGLAGPRLFRGAPFPLINFDHPTKEAAEEDAQKLRDYLAALPDKKPAKKKGGSYEEGD